MYKKKSLLITFEGIEGSGKSFQSKKLFNKIRKLNLSTIYTREPGGSKSAEKIRKLILTGNKDKFNKLTDTLLYFASRSEHFEKTIKPALKKKKVIICDRFTDSTIAYQVFGKGINKLFVNLVHKEILGSFTPDLTFILKLNIKKALQRVNKRKNKNRYDNFSKKFYANVQKGFLSVAKKNKKRYFVVDTSTDTNETENIIFNKFISLLKK
jgi:dTMP kinase